MVLSGSTVASLFQDVRRDRKLIEEIFTVRFLATFLFRTAQVVGKRSSFLATVVKQVNNLLTGADLAWQAEVGSGIRLHHPVGVVWGPDVTMAEGVELQQGVTIGGTGVQPALGFPVLGSRVRVGAGARILGAVEIGNDCKIGANAVVLISIPAESTAVGVPAHVLLSAAKSADDVGNE